ncbi:hypothetical protein [Methylobacterium dankookense]|uniref:REase AHJR-like domain-containing protein n=1 Tax=Methylobacterium dankookense TaxID=560405 RepID=A0A564FVQ4_9HYPH|nr:hypothetical protein [Methylobacterium dankookense]VUF12102.1 hypothetical protein MTDSW087_01790 [Methylobacterium dankookense]
MASYAPLSRREVETQFMERLRGRYEDAGFRFTLHPRAEQLPDFLGSYLPDALAEKPGRNIVIEVKDRPGPSSDHSLQDIRGLFDGHPDWHLHVAFIGGDPLQSLVLDTAAPELLRSHIEEVRDLRRAGHRRAAFIMAWSLLETALRLREEEAEGRARAPGTLVQTLAMQGYIEPETERRGRGLIDLRNRIVHGDLMAEPTDADIEQVLAAVEETVSVTGG